MDIDATERAGDRGDMALAGSMLLAMPLLLSSAHPVSTRAATLAPPSAAQDVIVVLQETRTPEPKKKTVRHQAVLKNSGSRPVHGLRVTIELYDYFGGLLWSRTAPASPATLRPGETGTVAIATPDLPAHRKTRYRFDARSP